MRIPYKSTLIIAIGILTVIFIAGCVDTSVNPIPNSIDYQSQVKVVNLVSGAGQATLSLNGQSLGSAAFGSDAPSGTGFLQVPAGDKTLSATFTSAASKTYNFSLNTDYKYRVFLVGDASSSNAVRMYQRYIWQTKDSKEGATLFPDGYGWVAVFNGSPDAVLNSITIDGTTTTFTGGLAMGQAKGYIKLAAGSHNFEVNYDNNKTFSFAYTVASKGRYTAVAFDVAASIQNAVLVDD